MNTNLAFEQALLAHREFVSGLAERASEKMTASFAQGRRYFGLPPYEMHANRTMLVPPRFLCPECGSRIRIDVEAWSVRDGTPVSGGINVLCVADDDAMWQAWDRDEDFVDGHRYYFGDWIDIRTKVERWAVRYLRVVQEKRGISSGYR